MQHFTASKQHETTQQLAQVGCSTRLRSKAVTAGRAHSVAGSRGDRFDGGIDSLRPLAYIQSQRYVF